MLIKRKSEERGYANHGWLEARHTFSFSEYYDPDHMGFRVLRVINQDKVAAGTGFATHGHKDMEIITYVTHGALEHKDTLGNQATIRPGEVQRMSAGTGIRHSEFNHSQQEDVKLLQIWIMPEKNDIQPSYEQKSFSDKYKKNELYLTVSPNGREGSLKVHQDMCLYVGHFSKNGEQKIEFNNKRFAWIQLVKGALSINAQGMVAGDGLAVADESQLHIVAEDESEFLFFDLP